MLICSGLRFKVFFSHCTLSECAWAIHICISHMYMYIAVTLGGISHILQFFIIRREHTAHLLFCAPDWWVRRNPLVQYALMDCLFDHNICGERPHEHISSITQRAQTHTNTITSPSRTHISFSTWDLENEKKNTQLSFTPPPQQRWPLHLHLYSFYSHTQ